MPFCILLRVSLQGINMSDNFVCGDGLCTACGVCVDACPFKALCMNDSDGELTLQVDSELCRECGRCHLVCPALNPIELRKPLKTFAAWSCVSDDIERSSSGGLATVLARMVIEEGGTVFGTASRDGFTKCVEITNLDGLEALRGSKYVYSSPEGAYRRVKELIFQGTPVFFVSVPCQVAALRSFLGGKDEGLLCADLICHGTPPMSYLRDHLASRVMGSWDSFSFRGVREFQLCAYRGEELVYNKPCFEDEYFSAFEAGIAHRDVCYECPYARNERAGDLTLGDFWGLNKETLSSTPPGKVSLVLANTPRGMKALGSLPETVIMEERSFWEADNEEQTNLHEPSSKTRDRVRFSSALKKVGFDAAVHKTIAWKRFRFRALKHKLLSCLQR